MGPADNWTDAQVSRFLRDVFGPDAIAEEPTVSIQILDNNNPDARREVRERIGGLVRTLGATLVDAGTDADKLHAAEQQFREEVKALYFALTGHGATDEDVKVLTGQ